MRFGKVQEFQGLKFETDVNAGTNIAAVVGRNGSGKSRLLHAIMNERIEVSINGAIVNRSEIRLIQLNELQPSFGAGYDSLLQRERCSQAVAMYNAYKGKFGIDPQQSAAAFGQQVMGNRRSQVDIHQLGQAVSQASQDLGKDPNDLSNDDISDYFSGVGFSSMGSINVTGLVRAYWDRVEDNNYNEFRIEKYGEEVPFWPTEQFVKRFGPPPWEVLNDFLRDTLDGRYYFEVPSRENIDSYCGRLYRTKDNLVVDPSWLSSGEKVLMWLCLSMYATNAPRSPVPPKLLLLDEPDSALHPEMVQKLHMVLRSIVDRFATGILFTSHSPTTIALFNAGPIWKISDNSLVEVDKDTAVGELLIGLDQVVVHYSRCRQVYVESHYDQEIYGEIFACLRRWDIGTSEHIALSFVAAAPKLAAQNIRDQIITHLGHLDEERIEAFVKAINGQGDCAQVRGAVESLNVENGVPVCGIIDWDGDNKPQDHIYVLGEGLFDNIESAVLNPLTLGFYLLQNYSGYLNPLDYGLDEGFDFIAKVADFSCWQGVADGVMRRVLGEAEIQHDVKCAFVKGGSVSLDERYTHMDGHALEKKVRGNAAYPFLNEIRRTPLPVDVIRRGIRASGGLTLPCAFSDLFKEIQAAG